MEAICNEVNAASRAAPHVSVEVRVFSASPFGIRLSVSLIFYALQVLVIISFIRYFDSNGSFCKEHMPVLCYYHIDIFGSLTN